MTLGNVTLRSRSSAPKLHPTEANIGGSKEKMVGRNGEINASSNQELMQQIAHLAHKVSQGEVARPNENEASDQSPQQKRQQVLQAAYFSDKGGREWAELGAAIGGEVSETADREGFMRRLFLRSDVAQGTMPRIRVRHKNVVAIQASSAVQNYPIFLRDKYIVPEEFYIKSNIRVEERELMQGSGDILEDKFYEVQEAIMVEEDRRWKSLVDDAVGIANDRQILAGGLTPATLSQMRTQVLRWGIPAQNLLLASDIWDDIIGQSEFAQWFDPVSQYELVMTGNLGTLLGMSVITDAFREPMLKVLDQGDIYVTSSPEMHGTYTDRGPVQSNEVNDYPDGVPARGWSFYELISMTMHNARSVVKGRKQ